MRALFVEWLRAAIMFLGTLSLASLLFVFALVSAQLTLDRSRRRRRRARPEQGRCLRCFAPGEFSKPLIDREDRLCGLCSLAALEARQLYRQLARRER